MAKIDIINIRGNTGQCVNLSGSVGAGGKNHKADVLLIQALFFYLYADKEAKLAGLPVFTPALALAGPSITGLFDLLTIQTITYFQILHRRQLLSVDSIIHPASYEGRVIKDTTKPLMMITYLHLLARKRELATGTGDYIKSVVNTIKLYHQFELVAKLAHKS